MNPLALLTGGLVETVIGGLKSVGIIKDPEAELKAKALVTEQMNKAQDFMLDYWGKMKDLPPFVQIMRGCQRPFIVYTFHIFVWASFLVKGQFPDQVIFTYKGTEITIMAIYVFILGMLFLGRSVEKIILKKVQNLL